MHNLTKIKLFRALLWMTYPLCWVVFKPLIALRRKSACKNFFFFDRYAIGGAQRVHLDILESISEVEKIVYFTRLSLNNKFKGQFFSFHLAKCKDIHLWCDYLVLRLFSVHYYAMLVNSVNSATVLGSNSTFFYDMLPFFTKDVRKIELLHNFSFGKNGMEFFGLANYKYLNDRLVIDAATKSNIINQYKQYNVPELFTGLVQLIEYGVDIPPFLTKKSPPPLNILYAGRGTPQKRIWLINRIAEHFIDNDERMKFIFAGPIGSELSEKVLKGSKFLGEVGDRHLMEQIFIESHVSLLTSSFEGFPVVIKEAMSYGCIPVVTALEGNKTHLEHGKNSLLIDNPQDESHVVEAAIKHLTRLLEDTSLRAVLSEEAYSYAFKNFRKENFMIKYRDLLLSDKFIK